MGQGSNMNNNNISSHRAESVPPQVHGLLTTNGHGSNLMHVQHANTLPNSVSYMRAQSEQPYFGANATANFGNAPQTPMSPVSIYPMYNNMQPMMRNGNGGQHQQMQAKALNNMTNNLSNNRLGRMQPMSGNGGQSTEHHLFGNNMLNLNPMTNNNSNISSNATTLDNLPPLHHHFGGHHNTLNNQVPPGNRANNYWDNFRR